MARFPRITIPGIPHHVIQRGNRRQQTFFCDEDYETFLKLFRTSCDVHKVEIWSYVLMPNHTHAVAVPFKKESLSFAMADAYENYARLVNARNGWRGHLWQERFKSTPMDEEHLYATVRYIELNPVRAGLCNNPFSYRWSSARIHLNQERNNFVKTQPMAERIDDWVDYLGIPMDDEMLAKIRKNTNTGRPLGSADFVAKLERLSGRKLSVSKPGPKPS